MNNNNNDNNPNYYNINQAYNEDKTVSPMGLDFKQYLNQQNQSIPTSSDNAIINEALENNNDFLKIMQKRDKDLKLLTNGWTKGKKTEIIETIASMNDIGIVNNFVLYGIIKTELKRIDISCSDANILFPCILDLVSSKNEQHFLNGILSSWVLLRMFEDVISQTKQSEYKGGIDISKEDKLKKYNLFISYIQKVRNSNNFNKYYHNNSKIEGVDLKKFANEADYFLRNCNFN